MAKVHTNVFMMLAGHVTGQGSRADTFNGNTIHTFVSDYQGWTNGGNGFLRIIHFAKADNQVVLQTYSPWTGQYDTGPGSEVFFNYNMQTVGGGLTNAPFVALGTFSNVVPGNVVSCLWTGLQSYTGYEWYASVSDGVGNTTTTPVWKFFTAPAVPPPPPAVSNTLVTVYGDAPTNLNLIAYNTNGGGPVTFQTNTLPTQGLIQNFTAANGSFTYSPARSFRGLERFTFSASDFGGSSGVATYNINVVSPADTNADGLPDGWEAAYGVSDPNADSDGDGQTNGEEYLAGTNPTNAASVLKITGVSRQSNGHVVLTWASVGGTRYRIQFANASANGALPTFTDVTRSLSVEMDGASYGSPSTQSFTDDFTLTGAPANGGRYYRIKIVP
jgi:hypothetical protein